jgi:metal-sulfur cluster biosynthetic enzyme
MEVLRMVIDPEIGINIVDLGLVYSVEAGQGHVQVAMTLTTPGCPAGRYLADRAEALIRQHIKEVTSATVDIVWDPPWSFERMSETAKKQLGWGGRG